MTRWEVFLAAPWAAGDPDDARRSVVAELVSWLTPEERTEFGGVKVLRPCDDFVCALLDRVEGHELVHELRATMIQGVDIERAVIINSCSAE
ncbi:MAG TPA: hypothetical protein VK420_21305 [Longimicrobium sp.]|jgi:hypothetical protein|nr:hypothetical protein [Longimicrobium sp.]